MKNGALTSPPVNLAPLKFSSLKPLLAMCLNGAQFLMMIYLSFFFPFSFFPFPFIFLLFLCPFSDQGAEVPKAPQDMPLVAKAFQK